jgi:tetratricopeptide (TPR) repeat protein
MTTKPFLDVATLIEAHRRTGAPGRFIDAATIMDELPPARAAEARFPAANRATIQDRLEDEDGLCRRLERDPSDPVAGDLLEALYRRRGDHEQAVALLIDRAEAAGSPESKVGLLVRAAHLYRTELADLGAARMVLVTALSASPSDTRVQDELDAVVCASGDFAAARAAYADAALAVEDPGLAGELWLRVSSLHIMERSGGHAVSAALARIEVLDTERAEQLLALCERMAGDLMVLDALAALYRRLGDTAGAARVLALSIEHAGDSQDRARRHHAIAELGDELEAEWHLAEAVRLAPGRTQSRAALADLYRRRGESRRAARLLEEARMVALNPVDRANLACQAASIYANDLDDGTHAADLYEIAIKSDPERAEAASPLAERYWQRGCYAELEPLIEVLARRAVAAGNDHDSAEICYRAGKTALELGKPERALEYLRASIDCAPYHLEALRARAQAAALVDRVDEAYDALTAALEVQERDGAGGEELAETVTELAILAERQGDVDAAIDLYRAALGRVPGHPRALAAALTLLRARRDLDGAAEILWQAAESTDGEPRVRALADLAALHVRGLDDPERAMDLYREALSLAPTDQAVLTALVELYTAAELWQEAVAVLCTLAELEPEGLRSARYFQIAAQLARGRLPDEETAALFARALDAFFADGAPADRSMCQRAFGDLESLLYGRRAFKALERAYRIMIKRLPVGSPELADLWTRLGALYREELGQPAAAIQSYEVAAELDGDRATRHRVLIDLYEGFAPDQLDKLIERRHRLLRREPTAPEHYRALAILHRRAGRKDQAFLALRALAALGAASSDEQDRLARLDGARPSWPTRPLSPEHHARLRCPEEDPRLTGILGLVTDAIAGELAVPPRRLRLRDDLSPAWYPVRDLHAGVSGLIGIAPPPLLVCPELDAEVVFANLKSGAGASRSVAIGLQIAGSSRGEAVHTLARVLSHARPAFFLRLLLSGPGGLDDALDAALMVGGYGGSLSPAPGAHRFAAAIARGLPPSFRDQLAGLVQSIEEPRHQLSVERWGQAVDTTCRLTALLLTGDLPTAIAALGREPAHAARRPYSDRLAELLVHSCSEAHAELRAAIGLAIA